MSSLGEIFAYVEQHGIDLHVEGQQLIQSGIRNKLRLLRTDLRNAHSRNKYIKFPDALRKKILGNIEKILLMPAYRMAKFGDQMLRSVETV